MTLGLETKQGFRPNHCAIQTYLGSTSYAESELSSANTMASQMSARSKVSARSRSSNLQHVSLTLIHRLLCSLYSTVIAPRCTQPSPEWPKEASIADLQHVILSMLLCSKHSFLIATAYTRPFPGHHERCLCHTQPGAGQEKGDWLQTSKMICQLLAKPVAPL